MMEIARAPHRRAVTPKQASAIQRHLAALVRQIPLGRPLRLLAGLDAALARDGRRCLAAVVVWDVRERTVLARHVAVRPWSFR